MRAIEHDERLNTFLVLIRKSIARFGVFGSFARFLMMKDSLKKFINNPDSAADKLFRKKLVDDFQKIHKNIACAHSPYQFILMAEYIFNLEIEGPIVQCGCFKGGSSAQLSLIAKRTGRRLYICDSFQGLPEPESDSELNLAGHDKKFNLSFKAGDYRGALDEVKDNIERFGYLDICDFIPGFFSESLANFEVNPAFVFIDVDLVSSARDCLKYLWPRLIGGGYWFTHEAPFANYILGMLDRDWWRENLAEIPPVIWGAGSGLSELTPGIAYLKK